MGPRVISKIQHFDFNRDKLYSDERMKFLLIRDTIDYTGVNLFKAILNLYCKSETNIAVLSLDGPVKDIVSGLNFNQDKFSTIDEFSSLSLCNEKQRLDEAYFEKFLKHEGLLCLYSLSTLIIQESANKIYRLLYNLLNENPKLQVLALLHEDVHSEKDIIIFDNLASSVIDTSVLMDCNKFLLTMATTSKSYGQVVYNYELPPGEFSFVIIEKEEKQSSKLPAKKPDPTANLTFNLNLNEREKKAREQLQMPYAKSEVVESVTTQDLEDFYEEDDPDDDLDFLEAV